MQFHFYSILMGWRNDVFKKKIRYFSYIRVCIIIYNRESETKQRALIKIIYLKHYKAKRLFLFNNDNNTYSAIEIIVSYNLSECLQDWIPDEDYVINPSRESAVLRRVWYRYLFYRFNAIRITMVLFSISRPSFGFGPAISRSKHRLDNYYLLLYYISVRAIVYCTFSNFLATALQYVYVYNNNRNTIFWTHSRMTFLPPWIVHTDSQSPPTRYRYLRISTLSFSTRTATSKTSESDRAHLTCVIQTVCTETLQYIIWPKTTIGQ